MEKIITNEYNLKDEDMTEVVKRVKVLLINSKNEILVQKRAACKKNHPNKWDMPSAGHVDAGETITVHLSGGDLKIKWSGHEEDSVFMTGPAENVFTGEVSL